MLVPGMADASTAAETEPKEVRHDAETSLVVDHSRFLAIVALSCGTAGAPVKPSRPVFVVRFLAMSGCDYDPSQPPPKPARLRPLTR